jgi:squalene-hopene cyclase-like protein/prenyltransferase/squalene oxidase-like repeat protein
MRTTGLAHRIPARASLTTAAGRLVAEVAADPVGKVTASVYDCGRLVALAPWLAGHRARREFLCRSQRPDRGWGGPGGYALVPTLSATAALLAELARPVEPQARHRLVRAATGGLQALHRLLDPDPAPEIPDTVASELVVPALVQEVNRLAAAASGLPDGLARPLRAPAGFDPRALDRARERCATGQLPPAMTYCLEALGTAAAGAPAVRPVLGTVGCSPAATAAWAGGPDGPRESLAYLETVQARGGGPVPVVTPIRYFEPAWVLNSLGAAGLAMTAPAALASLLDRLEQGLTSAGAPVAPGLPPDADDTGAVLSALLRHGRVRAPHSLLGYQADGYFRCYHSERDPSLSTNAHVLEALALYLRKRPGDRARFGPAAEVAAGWLLAQQRPDGSWWDKWHASPYYATACTAAALALHGGPGTAPAMARAAAWVMETQRPDGSWGRWQGSVEETSYAVQVLARAAPAIADQAIRRARAYLADPPSSTVDPPLWHGKDLYTPVRVVRAARLAALQVASGARGSGTRRP